MKKILIILLLLPSLGWGADKGGGACDTCADTNWSSCTAADAEYATVNTCVGNANAEATINVPAGNVTWSSRLSITQGVNLIGAGIDVTIVHPTNSSGAISYNLTEAMAANNYAFRLSGFTFDFDGSNSVEGIYLQANERTTRQTKVRIDHNKFMDAAGSTGAIYNLNMNGVVDNNIFNDVRAPVRSDGDIIRTWWDNFPNINHGTGDSLYFEDNTFTYSNASNGAYMVSDCFEGARYVFRYNDITTDSQLFPMWDMHLGCQGGAVYGNDLTDNGGSHALSGQRGGSSIFHHNKVGSGMALRIYNSNSPPCAGDTYPEYIVADTYNFLNRDALAGNLITSSVTSDSCGYLAGSEGSLWWQDDTASPPIGDGTEGVGCGTLANRPATCTAGVGYWATDQSCSDLTGLVGNSPSTPISGTLYTCDAGGNAWSEFYTPHTYPHPLRGEGGSSNTLTGGSLTGVSIQ